MFLSLLKDFMNPLNRFGNSEVGNNEGIIGKQPGGPFSFLNINGSLILQNVDVECITAIFKRTYLSFIYFMKICHAKLSTPYKPSVTTSFSQSLQAVWLPFLLHFHPLKEVLFALCNSDDLYFHWRNFRKADHCPCFCQSDLPHMKL